MIKTKRLILRPWLPEDFAPFAQMNADPRVRQYFLSTLTPKESNLEASAHARFIEEHGWGLWAVSVPSVADFIGFIGLNQIRFTAPFTPAIEIGWRLAHEYWGKGYATEGALASLTYGFDTLKLNEIVSFTSIHNIPSISIMKKIGMKHNPADDFDHPKISKGHPLRRHVLYRINKQLYDATQL
jgi:3-dehydroquinate dehydratase/shikimate dehydrogenase